MWKKVTVMSAGLALALAVAWSASSVAFAHHGRSYSRAVRPSQTQTVAPAQNQAAPVCYWDGSCDVNGVCQLGVSCDGSVHHSQSYYNGRAGHHQGGHH